MGDACVDSRGLLRHTAACAGHYLSPSRLSKLKSLPFPKHVFGSSEHDQLVQHTNSEPLAKAIGAKLKMYPDAGHDLFIGADTFLADISSFITTSHETTTIQFRS